MFHNLNNYSHLRRNCSVFLSTTWFTGPPACARGIDCLAPPKVNQVVELTPTRRSKNLSIVPEAV